MMQIWLKRHGQCEDVASLLPQKVARCEPGFAAVTLLPVGA